jgi:hypothetical protein
MNPYLEQNDTWEDLYAYLKGRSEGNIAPGHLYPIEALRTE